MFTAVVRGTYPKYPSAPRPSLLSRALRQWRARQIDDRDLERAFRRAQVEVVAEMVVAGMEVVWDGQLRWDGPADFICRRLHGFEVGPDRLIGQQISPPAGDDTPTADSGTDEPSDGGNGHHAEALQPHASPRAIERIDWERPILAADFRFLADRSPVDLRPVLTGPYSLAGFCDPGIYEDRLAEFLFDIARALNREIEGLVAAGAKSVLIEEPLLTSSSSDIDLFFNAARRLTEGIEATLFLAPGGDVIGMEGLLARSGFRGLALDVSNAPPNAELRDDPAFFMGRVIELGVVDGRSVRVESPEEVAEALVKWGERRDPHLLWAAPSCGLGRLTREAAFEKLQALARGVELARREMAGREE